MLEDYSEHMKLRYFTEVSAICAEIRLLASENRTDFCITVIYRSCIPKNKFKIFLKDIKSYMCKFYRTKIEATQNYALVYVYFREPTKKIDEIFNCPHTNDQ